MAAVAEELLVDLTAFDHGDQRRHRFLPQQRRAGVDQQQNPGDDQDRGDVPDQAPHLRIADSVPPSDPGPAYVTGPRTVTGVWSGAGARRALSATSTIEPVQP